MEDKKASLLIAMPPLEESIFKESVILLSESDADGALGFMFNKDTGASLEAAMKLLQLETLDHQGLPLLLGGPVQPDFFWFLHEPTFIGQNTMLLCQDLFLSPASEVIGIERPLERPVLFAAGIGYSGWGPGQLEKELEEGAWWQTEFRSELFLETPLTERWNNAIEGLGAQVDHLIDRTDFLDPTIN